MSNTIPVFRVFDYNKTIEFYVQWLGAKLVWEHKPPGTPFYLQVSLKGSIINLSAHHGECSPGALVLIEHVPDLKDYHQQLLAKDYPYMRPGLEKQEWDADTLMLTVIDPFYNRIIFTEKE